MKRIITASIVAAGLLIAVSANAQKTPFSLKNKSVKVYVTEKGTDNRMTAAGTLKF